MATTSEIQVTEAYIGLLGRAPDPDGLAYWVKQYDNAVAAGQDSTFALKKLMNDIAKSPEYKAGTQGTNVPATGNPSTAQAEAIVQDIYNNLFDRDATQADKDYWAPQLTGGSTTAPEMTINLITAAKGNANTTDADVLGFKQQAGTYYVETVAQADFNQTNAASAVSGVNGPISLNTSKLATDALATGTGINVTLTTGDDSAKLVMTLGDDTVTGTVGTGATYAAGTDSIVDASSNDADTLTLTGDNGFTFGTVTKVETVNLNLAKQVGGAFTIADVNKVTGSTINVDVAETVTIAGVSVTGETDLVMNGGLASNVSTTDVKTFAAALATGTAEADVTITGDVDLAAVTIGSVADSATNLVLADNDAAIKFAGTAATNDAASVSTSGKVSIDVSNDAGGTDPEGIEKVTLEGNGAALTATITGVAAGKSDVADMVYTTTGSQAVTLKGAVDQFAGASLVQSGTGATGVTLTTVDSFDFSTWGVLGGGITLGADAGAADDTFKLAAGTDVTYTVAQNANAGQTFDANDTATDSSITINANVDVGELLFEDFESISIATNDSAAITIDEITSANNDATVSVVGANDITITGTLGTTGDTVVSGKKLVLGGATTVDAANDVNSADLTLTASDDIATAALTVQNDIVITATNDITITGGSNAAQGSMTVTGDDFDATGLTDAQNDITITVTNDVDLDGVTSSNGNVSITGATIDNATAAITVSNGNVTLTATNDAATSTINQAITTKTLTLADGKFTNGGTVVYTADSVVISGDTDVLDSDFITPSLVITSTNDVTIGTIDEKVAGEGFVVAGSGASGKINITTDANATTAGTATIYTGSGADTITANDTNTTFVINSGGNATTETINLDEVATGTVVNSGAGDDVIDIDDTSAVVITIDAGEGNDTVNLAAAAVTGTFDLGAGTSDKVVLQQAGGQTYTALGLKNIEELDITAGAATFTWADLAGNDTTFELTGAQTLTITGAATAETIDMRGITPNTLAAPNVTINADGGADVVTANEDTITTINGGAGADTITGGDGGDTLNGDADNDTITGGKGADSINGGAGFDSIVLTEGVASQDLVTIGDDMDTITGLAIGAGGTDDHLIIDISDVEGTSGGTDLVTTNGVSLANANAVVVANVAGATDLEAVDANILHLGEFASTSAVEDALEVGGTRELTAGAVAKALAANDIFLVLYDDGTKSYLAAVQTTAGADNTTFGTGDLTVVVIATLASNADASQFAAGDFGAFAG